jgi:hypothetical protein
MVEPAILGPIDALLAPVIEYVVLVLVLANLGTRYLAHGSHVRQAEQSEDVSRHYLHELSNVVLVLVSFYYLTLHHHSGIVLSMLVIGTVLTDFFEFEARRVEARQGLPIEQPKGAIVASAVVFLYAAYLSLFFVVEPVWSAIV